MWKHKLAEALEEGHPKENIVICRESSSGLRMFSQLPWESFLPLAIPPDGSSCLYEVIRGCRRHKMYFDIDARGEMFEESVNVVKSLKMVIQSLIPEAEIGVFTSSSSEKSSFHIIIDGYHVDNNAESLAVYRTVMDKLSYSGEVKVDRLYSSNQQLRILGWSKPGKGRFKVLDPELSSGSFLKMQSIQLLQASLVSIVGGSSRKIFLETATTTPKTQEVPSYGTLLSLTEISSLKTALKKMRLPFKVIGPADGAPSIINLKRKSPAYCILCERTHNHENAFVAVGRDGVLRFFCRRDSSKNHYINIVLETTSREGDDAPSELPPTTPPTTPSTTPPTTPSELLTMMVET